MTLPRTRPDAPARRAVSEPSRIAVSIVGLPDRIVMLLFWCALVVAGAVLCSQFRPVVVLPLLVVVLVSTWRLVPAPLHADRRTLASSAVALGATALWLALNIPYASRFVVVWRDPGFLTLEGIWLSGHASAEIPVGAAVQVQHAVPGLSAQTGAYDLVGTSLQVQGAKLLPGMLGLAGWVGGEHAVLEANLAIGAVGLLAVFALARRVVNPVVALVPMLALAVSLPMIAFSRSAYTEPVTLALVVGGLTMAWSAAETRTWWRYLVAGAMVGATALVRIDGAASVIGIVAGIGLTAAAALTPRSRRRQLTALCLVAAGAIVMVALGYLDLRLHSQDYLSDLWRRFRQLMVGLGLTVVGVVLLSVPAWFDPVRRRILARRRALAAAGAVLVVAVAVLLALRPLWMVNHHVPAGTGYADLIGSLQEQAGLPVDPTRSYDEYSLSWHAWYYGWPTVVLAVAGSAVVVHRMIRRRDPRLAFLVGVVVVPSLLYLWVVSITPYQVWAMRRFLPVTIPGLLLAAAVTVDLLWARGSRLGRAAAVLGTGLVLALPLTTWGPLLGVVEQDARLGEAHAACAAIGDDPVLYLHVGTESPPYLATIRTMCGVEVVQATEPPTQADLAAVRAAWGGGDVKVVAFLPDVLPWPGGRAPEPLRVSAITEWERAVQRVPTDAVDTRSTLWVATIEPDGSLTPVSGGTGAP
ncbi:hypothetical protein [Cellulomonas sp. P5_C6]